MGLRYITPAVPTSLSNSFTVDDAGFEEDKTNILPSSSSCCFCVGNRGLFRLCERVVRRRCLCRKASSHSFRHAVCLGIDVCTSMPRYRSYQEIITDNMM